MEAIMNQENPIVSMDMAFKTLPEIFPDRPPKFISNNSRAIEKGAEFSLKEG